MHVITFITPSNEPLMEPLEQSKTRRVRVAIEAVGVKMGGGAHVLRRLIGALLDDPRVGALTVFTSPSELRSFEVPDDPRAVALDIPGAERYVGRVAWLEVGVSRLAASLRADVVVCFNAIGAVAGIPQINIVQQPLMFNRAALALMPPLFQTKARVIKRLTRSSCSSAEWVITQTHVVADAVRRDFDVSPDKVQVFTPDIEWLDAPMISKVSTVFRDAPADRRLLYVGSDLAYKDVGTLVAALSVARRTFPDLVLFATIPEEHWFASEPGVVALGALAPGEVRVAMEAATILVMPSLAETVGLPMLEACAIGCPVLAADLPYAREICGEAASFFRANNVKACARAICALIADPAARDALARRGRGRAEDLRAARPYEGMAELIIRAGCSDSG